MSTNCCDEADKQKLKEIKKKKKKNRGKSFYTACWTWKKYWFTVRKN